MTQWRDRDDESVTQSWLVVSQRQRTAGLSVGHRWEFSDRREAFVYWNSGASLYEVALEQHVRIAADADAEVAVADTELPVYAFRIPD